MKVSNFLNISWKKKLNTLFLNRKFKSRDDLIEEGINKSYNEDILVKVISFIYDYLPKLNHYAISYYDDVNTDYGIDEEDLGDFYSKTLKELNIEVPINKKQEKFLEKNRGGYAVESLIKFITWCKDESISNETSL